MRRNATYLAASLVFVVAVAGCKQAGKQVEMGPSVAAATPYSPELEESTYETTSYPTYGSSIPVESANEPTSSSFASEPVTTSEPRYHTVVRHDTLYGLARTYFGDQRRWKDIYEANRSMISDPNKIRVGQRLLIPD